MAFVLVLVRVAGVFAFLPIMGEGYAPQVVKALASLVVAIVLVPVTAAALPVNAWDPLQFFLYVGAEALFGAMMGVCALFIFKALTMAGDIVGQQMGMALDFVADPITGEDTGPVSTFCEVVGVMTFFSVGGHLWMVQALHQSFSQWPLGAFLSPEFIRHMSVGATAQGLIMAFQLASPLLLLTFLVSLAMAVMARLVPEMNILIVGFPVKVGVGLIGLAIFVPVLVRYCAELSRVMTDFMGGVAAGA